MSKEKLRQISAKELDRWFHSHLLQPVLIDVREDEELAIAPFPQTVIHLPLSRAVEFEEGLQKKLPKDQPIVVICHAGIRSRSFGYWLIEQDLGYEVWNLEGGIDAWSIEVDPRVKRY